MFLRTFSAPAAPHFVVGAAGAADVSVGAAGVDGVDGIAEVSVGAAPPVVLVGSAAGLSPPHATEPITHAIETKRAIFFMSSSIVIKGIRREESHAVHTASGGRRQGARVWGQPSTIFAAFKALSAPPDLDFRAPSDARSPKKSHKQRVIVSERASDWRAE